MNQYTFNLKYFINTFLSLFMFSTVLGQDVKEVNIGNQIWMSENLNVDKFNNGTPIPEAKSFQEWNEYSKIGKPVWCYYDFNRENIKYGKLYNIYAVIDSRGLAPKGWQIPNRNDFQNLLDFLGGQEKGQKKIQIASTKLRSDFDWFNSNNGNNTSGFSALPGGRLSGGEVFLNKGEAVEFWSNDNWNNDKRTYYTLILRVDNEADGQYNGIFQEGHFGDGYFAGLYVRAIKSTKN